MNSPSRRRSLALLLIPIACLVLVSGCAVFRRSCVTEGISYCQVRGNFTGRWYDYYERALSCMEGGCYQAALADLQEAIQRREADQRRARTVGMHFVDYFPHREKGLIHYLEGDYVTAKQELERSLAQYPSEKARFYLDRVRVRLLREAGRTPTPPRLTLAHRAEPTEGVVWVREDPVRIAGTATDRDELIAEILIDGRPLFLEASAGEVRFSEDLVLAEGQHDIEVRARNLLGGEDRQWVRFQVDRSGPIIAVDRFIPGRVVSGRLLDSAGIAGFRINGQAVHLSGEGPIPFKGFLDSRNVTLTAFDQLGNETRLQLSERERTGQWTEFVSAHGWMAMAERDAAASDGEDPYSFARAADAPLTVDIGLSDPQVVFTESLGIPVRVRSEAEIRHLSVNDDAISVDRGGIISFNSFVRLTPGDNRVTVRAADANGRQVEKSLRIIRRIPEAFQLQHRYGIAVHPFDFTEQDPERIRFQHGVLEGLLQPRRFRLSVSDDLRSLLERQGLGVEGKADWGYPQAVLLGVVHETRNGFEAAARVVNVDTRETLAVGDVFAPATDETALSSLGRRLSEKFLRQFPLVSAGIADMSDNRLRIVLPEGEAGGKRLLPPAWPLLVYRPIETAEKAVGTDARIIGNATVADRPLTAIVPAGEAANIRPTDRIVAR